MINRISSHAGQFWPMMKSFTEWEQTICKMDIHMTLFANLPCLNEWILLCEGCFRRSRMRSLLFSPAVRFADLRECQQLRFVASFPENGMFR